MKGKASLPFYIVNKIFLHNTHLNTYTIGPYIGALSKIQLSHYLRTGFV